MSSISQIIRDIAPEMADLEPEYLDRLISYSKAQVCFGDRSIRNLAIALLTAHIFTISKRAGTAGTETSKREGDLSVSYGATAVTNGTLAVTSYGQEFERLKRISILGPRNRMVMPDDCKN
jgi:hypothetical protein